MTSLAFCEAGRAEVVATLVRIVKSILSCIPHFPSTFPVPFWDGVLLKSDPSVMISSRRLAALAARPGLNPCIASRPCLAGLSQHRINRHELIRHPSNRAWESTLAVNEDAKSNADADVQPVDKDSGHIAVKPNETVLFFDSEMPVTHALMDNCLCRSRRYLPSRTQ